MGLFTEQEKAGLDALFGEAMSTFLMPLTVYQEAQKTIIASDPNWNPLTAYNQNVTSPVEYTPVSTTISGRILWDKKQDWAFITPGGPHQGAAMKLRDQTNQAVRLKVDFSGHSLLKTAKKVEIDGVMLDRITEPRPHGLFGTGYWTYFYERAN